MRPSSVMYYTTISEDSAEDELDEDEVSVLEALAHEKPFFYDYDLGDDWAHQVVVEELICSASELKFAVCLDGQNTCPLGASQRVEHRSRRVEVRTAMSGPRPSARRRRAGRGPRCRAAKWRDRDALDPHSVGL